MKKLHLGQEEIVVGLVTIKNPEKIMVTTDTDDEGTHYHSGKDCMFLGHKIKGTVIVENGYFNLDDIFGGQK